MALTNSLFIVVLYNQGGQIARKEPATQTIFNRA